MTLQHSLETAKGSGGQWGEEGRKGLRASGLPPDPRVVAPSQEASCGEGGKTPRKTSNAALLVSLKLSEGTHTVLTGLEFPISQTSSREH